jgi:hypothetical protein
MLSSYISGLYGEERSLLCRSDLRKHLLAMVIQLFDTDIGEDREHSASFLYTSVPWYALKEMLLSVRARNWNRANATIQSSHRTIGGTRETVRVEIWYGYEIDGRHYAGRLIRERVLWGVQKVIDRYPEGRNVVALVNPLRPNESYLPSGLGYIEPILVGITCLGPLAILLGILAAMIGEAIKR